MFAYQTFIRDLATPLNDKTIIAVCYRHSLVTIVPVAINVLGLIIRSQALT